MSVSSMFQIRSKCLPSEWVSEWMNEWSTLTLANTPTTTESPLRWSCVSTQRVESSTHVNWGLRATPAHFRESDTAPTKQRGKSQTVLGDSFWFTSGKDQKHVKWHVTIVTRADRSHIYFRNLEFWQEQQCQSFKTCPAFSSVSTHL